MVVWTCSDLGFDLLCPGVSFLASISCLNFCWSCCCLSFLCCLGSVCPSETLRSEGSARGLEETGHISNLKSKTTWNTIPILLH